MGICGTGMGSFAGLLKAAGYQVRGSDENVYPPMSDKLAAWGIPVLPGYKPENLDPAPDLVIVGNVIRRTNPEAQAVLDRGLEYTSFPKALGDMFLADRHSVVVSGTHGKTTTSSLIAWLLYRGERDPSLLIGGVPENFGEGFRLGQGEHFVVEGDEYDTAFFDKVPKFVHYRPRTAVITSIEFDHADIYDSVEAIEAQFAKLVDLVPDTGVIVARAQDSRVRRIVDTAKAKVQRYALDETADADWHVRDLTFDKQGASFSIFQHRIRLGRFQLPMSGLYNVENALAATMVALRLGMSVAEIREAMPEFKGVSRRQSVRGEVGGIRVIDDFAHHPTAVQGTIAGIRTRYPDGRVFAVFEPRTATSSRRYFQDAYAAAFGDADEVIIAGVGRKELPDEERLDISRLAESINASGVSARSIAEIDEIVDLLAREAKPQDTLLFMSNGGFGGIHKKMIAALEGRPA